MAPQLDNRQLTLAKLVKLGCDGAMLTTTHTGIVGCELAGPDAFLYSAEQGALGRNKILTVGEVVRQLRAAGVKDTQPLNVVMHDDLTYDHMTVRSIRRGQPHRSRVIQVMVTPRGEPLCPPELL